MNRQRILASINRHLRAPCAETGEMRPLDEMVARVADELRSQPSDFEARKSSRSVVPVETVAAFVAGNVTEEESREICEAVLVDNSVLAELIAAVRGRSMAADETPPLSEPLTAKLLSMHPAPPSMLSGNAASVDGRQGSELRGGTERPRNGAVTPSTPLATVGLIEPTRPAARVRTRSSRFRHGWKMAFGIAVAACVVLLVGFGLQRWIGSQENIEIAAGDDAAGEFEQEWSTGSDRGLPWQDSEIGGSESPALANVDRGPESDPRTVEPDRAELNRDQTGTPETGDVAASDSSADDASPVSRNPEVESIVDDGTSRLPEDPNRDLDVALDRQLPDSPSVAANTRTPTLKWKQITGLLVRQPLAGSRSINSTAAADVPRLGGWQGVATDQPDAAPDGPVALRTLPLSRAEAEWEAGGRLVIAADTLLQLSRSKGPAAADFELRHGSVALIDVPEGTVINLVHGDRVLARLRWSEHAAAVVERAVNGFTVHVHRGTIGINDQPHQEEVVSVNSNQQIATLERPKRLPAWVDRPTDAVQLPRTILAQFAGTENVSRVINENIVALASAPRLNAEDQRTLSTLAAWQATMADTQLFRMLNSRIPAVRLAALQHLLQLPRSDPRFAPTWRQLDRVSANKQRVAQVRRWCEMARRGIRPNATQLEQMITGLAAQDVAGRAMADYLLRQFYNGGPRFDPTWTGAAQQRAINVWRQRVGLPAVRSGQPNAAVN